MSSSPEEGGTRIQRRQPNQQQIPMNDPRSMPQEERNRPPPQEYHQEQAYQHQVPPPQIIRPKLIGKRFINYDSVTFKYAVIVTCIFLLLNSKIIWKQIIQFPFMGTMEPSIVALIINSILAGIVFYVMSNFI